MLFVMNAEEGRKMNIKRKVRMKWTQRNVDRMHRWFNLSSDFQGWFSRNGQRIGYKICSVKQITFVFCG